MKKLFLGLLFCSLLFSIYSCEKEDLSSYKGPQGEKGSDGEDGANGSGFEMIFIDIPDSVVFWYAGEADVFVPELKQVFIDSGLISCYIITQDGIQGMPYYYTSSWPHGDQAINFKVKADTLILTYQSSQGAFYPSPDFSADYRLIAAKGFNDNKKAIEARVSAMEEDIQGQLNSNNQL